MKSLALVGSVALASFALTGCIGSTDSESDSSDVSAANSVSAKVPGMTVWFEKTAVPEWRYETDVWVLHGRTSKNLESAFSYSSDDEFGEALVTSARKLEVIVDVPSMAVLLEGRRIYVELTTTTGAHTHYFVGIQLAPRFARYSGSSKIFVLDPLSPVWVGSQVVWRGKGSLGSGVTGLAVQATDAATEGVNVAGKNVSFDWTWPNLMLAASPTTDVVHFTAKSGGSTVAKDAALELAVSELQLFEEVPEQDLGCDPAVLACLQALPNGTIDASKCGAGIAVRHCQSLLPAHARSASDFAVDLSSYLGGWYGEHGADAAKSGGVPLLQAQAGVHVASVVEITDPAGDPHGHDLTKYAVFSHPDVVFPGSDTVWFGAYDRKTGALTSVYDFN